MLVKSSEDVAALTLVSGVLNPVEPLLLPVGVVVNVEASPPEAFFAAFSASLFCFDAEGAIAIIKDD